MSTVFRKFLDENDGMLYNISWEVITLDLYKDLIRRRIKEKFKTIENFSKYTGIPRTTINFILKNGVGASNYDMVCKILGVLDIEPLHRQPVVMDADLLELMKIYSFLDDMGKHTVAAVAQTEYRRLHPVALEDAIIAAYGSISSGKPLTAEEKSILDIVEKIKKDAYENELTKACGTKDTFTK